jgi:arylsulfatase A-like enzyme
MRALDENVGAVLDAVERNGIAHKTLVLFFSDNGGARHMRNDPLRGRKGTVFEGGHRVPAIAWWPGRIEAGAKTNELCTTLDVMPTMLDLAGVDTPGDRPLDGVSLRGLMLDHEPLGDRQIFWNGVAMREGSWKLINRRGEQGRPLLFDLTEDIAESTNVADQHPERVKRMLEALDAWKTDVGR